MGIIALLASSNYVLFNRRIAKAFGIECAVLLGAMCAQADMCGNGFYYQLERIVEDTTLSEYLVRSAVKKLVDNGVLLVSKVGMPAKNRYTIVEEGIVRVLSCENQPTSGIEFAVTEGLQHKNSILSIYNTKSIESTKKPIKPKIQNQYGEFKNVLLTDEELTKLKAKFASDWQRRIEDASLYLKAKGDKYKNHYAMLLNWARMDKQRAPEQRRGEPIDY